MITCASEKRQVTIDFADSWRQHRAELQDQSVQNRAFLPSLCFPCLQSAKLENVQTTSECPADGCGTNVVDPSR